MKKQIQDDDDDIFTTKTIQQYSLSSEEDQLQPKTHTDKDTISTT